MDSSSSDKSSTARSVNKESMKLTVKLRQTNVDKTRHSTDKHWCIFFVVIFISWIVSWHRAIHNGTNYDGFSDTSIASKSISGFFHHETENSIASDDGVVTKNFSETFHHKTDNETNPFEDERRKIQRDSIVSLYTIVGVYTCNPSHLSEPPAHFHIVLVIMGHALFAMFYLVYLVHMYDNKMFCNQPSIVGATFLFVALLEHLPAMLYGSNSIAYSLLFTHERLAGWVIPEIMFLIIWSSMMFSAAQMGENEDNVPDSNSVDDKAESDIGKGSGHELDDDRGNGSDIGHFNYKIIPFSTYLPAIMVGIPTIVILKALMMSTMSILYDLSWRSKYFYIIAGGSIYVGFTIHYFALMVTSCAIAIASKAYSQSTYKSLQTALFIVARYHFGSACYHATMIFPRLRAKYVLKEPRFKLILEEKKAKEKIRVKHHELFKLSEILTSINGTNHSDSIRDLLRLYSRDLITKKSFENFGSISKSLLLFLLATNCLIIIIFWSNGIVDDDLALATWVMYLKIAFIFSLAMAFVTSTLDALKLSAMSTVLQDFSDKDICNIVVLRSVVERQSSANDGESL